MANQQCHYACIGSTEFQHNNHICQPARSTVIPINTATADANAFRFVVSHGFLSLMAFDVAPAAATHHSHAMIRHNFKLQPSACKFSCGCTTGSFRVTAAATRLLTRTTGDEGSEGAQRGAIQAAGMPLPAVVDGQGNDSCSRQKGWLQWTSDRA